MNQKQSQRHDPPINPWNRELRLSPEFFDERAMAVLKTLEEAGFEAWLVGGSVRDNILGRPLNDYDVTTDAKPREIIALFGNARSIPTGLKHGTVTVLSGGLPVEVTTFRQDCEYADHRRPKKVLFSNCLQDDVARRDFTINAIAWSPFNGLFDPFDGVRDIEESVVRAVGIPGQRFNEDALRILRAMRISSELRFTIDPATREAMLANVGLLRFISIERVTQEVSRIILANPGAVWADFQPIWQAIFPLLAESPSEIRAKISWNIFNMLSPLESVRFPAFFLLLSQFAQPTEEAHFIPSGPMSGIMESDDDSIAELLNCLRLSNDSYNHILRTAGALRDILRLLFDYRPPHVKHLRKPVSLRMDPGDYSGKIPERTEELTKRGTRYALRRAMREHGADSCRAAVDILQVALRFGYEQQLSDLLRAVNQVKYSEVPHTIGGLRIDGTAIMRYGVRPGEQIGEILRTLIEEVMAENIENDRESLLRAVRDILRYG
ncbi:MAG: CCA tRNA nucleotidyltransferase [Fastidiosipilaceae bacterium]|jgi:tRNA nucleotidyltransferase/poly(A) polymerase